MSFTKSVVNKVDIPFTLYGRLIKYEELVCTVRRYSKQKAVKITATTQDRLVIQKDLREVITYCKTHHDLEMEMEVIKGDLYLWKV